MTDDEDDVGARLEMLLVMQWLDEGADDEGAVALSVPTAANELGLEPDRTGLLAVMAALGELRGPPPRPRRLARRHGWQRARVTLSGDLRKDARRLFGRT